MLVSAMAKNADANSSSTRAPHSAPNGMSFTDSGRLIGSRAMQDDFEHELASHIGQQQETEAGHGPAQRHPAAPAAQAAAGDQHCEYCPRDDAEYDLVRGGLPWSAEYRFREHHPRKYREREQHEARGKNPERQPLEFDQRRQLPHEGRQRAAVKTGFE